MESGYLSMAEFVWCCIGSIFMWIFIAIRHVVRKLKSTVPDPLPDFTKPYSQFVRFLRGDQRRELPFYLGYLCCHGGVVAFRCVFVYIYVLSDDAMKAMAGMTFVVFMKLVYILAAQPYPNQR